MKLFKVKELKKLLENVDDDSSIFINLKKFECLECGNEYYGRVRVKGVDASLPQALVFEVSKSRYHDYPNTEEEN